MVKKFSQFKCRFLSVFVLFFLLFTASCFSQPEFGQIWAKVNTPLFSIIGESGSWNGTPSTSFLVFGHGLKDGDQFKLYSGGFDGQHISIGLVSSASIESGWAFAAENPVLTPDGSIAWEALDVGNAMVLKDGDAYMMWYTGLDNGMTHDEIGLATSPDGITWTKHANNPVLSFVPGTWEDTAVYAPYVIKDDGVFKMWYTGGNVGVDYGIGYATSPDGIVWTKSPANPVVSRGESGKWDSYLVQCPVVLKENGKYLMWFMGANGTVPGTGKMQTGFAISDDGINWTKDDEHNPVLPNGNASQNDSKVASCVQVYNDEGTYKMLYGASNLTSFFGVKLAVLQPPTSVENGNGLPNNFYLYQNYPNPFNPATGIKYQVSAFEKVQLKIFDILGSEVITLIDEYKVPGFYNIEFDASALTSGVYFLRMTAGSFISVKKLSLIK